MLLVLSPAKKLDYDSPVRTTLHTQPQYVAQAETLIGVLRQKSVADIARLMDLSDALAELNAARYAQWEPSFDTSVARQALLAFNGDVYEGLQAATLSDAQLGWAQDHVAILSGLYGILRPLDLMRPYRLEMGTRLETPQGRTLYAFWGQALAHHLNRALEEHACKVLLNLASEEYFKAVDASVLAHPVVQCVFQDEKPSGWKVVSFHAKRARGLMARHIIEHGVDDPAGLLDFASEGYAYAPAVSTPEKLVFRRPAGA